MDGSGKTRYKKIGKKQGEKKMKKTKKMHTILEVVPCGCCNPRYDVHHIRAEDAITAFDMFVKKNKDEEDYNYKEAVELAGPDKYKLGKREFLSWCDHNGASYLAVAGKCNIDTMDKFDCAINDIITAELAKDNKDA